MKSNNRGFTLIELVMVIVILGILAAVAIPRFANLSDNARKSTFQGAVGAVKSGVVTFLGEHSSYPTNLASTDADSLILNSDDFTITTGASVSDGTQYPEGGTLSSDATGDDYCISDANDNYVHIQYDETTGTVYGPTNW